MVFSATLLSVCRTQVLGLCCYSGNINMLSHHADTLVNISTLSHHADTLVNINTLSSHHVDALVNINMLSHHADALLTSTCYLTMWTP